MSNLRVVDFKPTLTKEQDEMVQILERWTKEAKEGKITGLLMASVNLDGSVDTARVYGNEYIRTAGACMILNSRVAEDAVQRKSDRTPDLPPGA